MNDLEKITKRMVEISRLISPATPHKEAMKLLKEFLELSKDAREISKYVQ